MNIGFFLEEMNFRGVVNSTYNYALYNKTILKNNSIIFYNKNNSFNQVDVIKKFKKKFKIYGVSEFKEIDSFKNNLKIDFLYTQKVGIKDKLICSNIKTIVHAVYPQPFKELHGYNYAYVSEWLSKYFSNYKIPYVPLIMEIDKNKNNLKKSLKIKKGQIVFGCHGGESSFDIKFVHDVVKKIVNLRKDFQFLFLNINKFYNHPRVKFIKGTADDILKKKFINTCDVMLYGRSQGESFGLACGEFALANKIILSYKFNRHRSHEFNIPKKLFIEYCSYKDLFNKLKNYKHKKIKGNKISKYNYYKPKKTMKIFNKVFFKTQNNFKFSIIDYIWNFFNHQKMNYLYLRHKIYNHYYNIIESKLLNKID